MATKDKQYFVTVGRDENVGDYILAENKIQAKKIFIKWIIKTMKVKELK